MRPRPALALVALLSGCMKWVPIAVPDAVIDNGPAPRWNRVRLPTEDGQQLVLIGASAKGDPPYRRASRPARPGCLASR